MGATEVSEQGWVLLLLDSGMGFQKVSEAVTLRFTETVEEILAVLAPGEQPVGLHHVCERRSIPSLLLALRMAALERSLFVALCTRSQAAPTVITLRLPLLRIGGVVERRLWGLLLDAAL